MITLITPTGGRPECFKLCVQYMERQTYKGPIQWLIIDDVEGVTTGTKTLGWRKDIEIEAVTSPKKWREGINTQRLNLDAAIPHIKGDYVCVIEDDDYYSPIYLEYMHTILQNIKVVGECNAKYYNLKHKCWKEMKNYEHASLASTAFHRDVLPLFEEAVNSGELYIDIKFWQLVRERDVSHALIAGGKNLVIGMKGLPGRKGIGIGHTPVGFNSDPVNYVQLKKWIGKEDFKLYEALI